MGALFRVSLPQTGGITTPAANKKLCPFAAAQPEQSDSDCLGEACACYIKTVKPAWISRIHGIVDPEQYYRYEGCGLVRVVPWQLVKREEKPNSPEDKQAEEAYKKLEGKTP